MLKDELMVEENREGNFRRPYKLAHSEVLNRENMKKKEINEVGIFMEMI